MASEILGLFGNQNPQQIRNAALESMLISPAQMGNQGLLQQIVSMGRNAGATAGMGIGQMFGGKVAGEVEASYIDQALEAASKAGGTPADKMKVVANFLADKPGMGAQYMKALEESRKLELTDLQTQKAKQDLQPEFKNIKVPVDTMEMGPDGKMYPVRKSIEITHKWNPVTKKYEPFQGEEGAKTTETPQPGAATDPKAQARAERERREKAGVYTNPVRPNAPQQTRPLPPAGSGGMNYGFETGGLIQPEGY